MASQYSARLLQFRVEVLGELQFARNLDGMQKHVEDWSPALQRIADRLQEHFADVFATEGGSNRDGQWAALSPRYAAWKLKHYPGKKTLNRTGGLERSLTRRSAKGSIRRIRRQELVMGSQLETPKGSRVLGILHQEGRGNNPVRRMIAIPDNVGQELRDIVAEQLRWE